MKYKVVMKCEHCKAIINETVEIGKLEVAQKIMQDAMINPLVGWCTKCDMKHMPYLLKIGEN